VFKRVAGLLVLTITLGGSFGLAQRGGNPGTTNELVTTTEVVTTTVVTKDCPRGKNDTGVITTQTFENTITTVRQGKGGGAGAIVSVTESGPQLVSTTTAPTGDGDCGGGNDR
jgi:hypothetical protein